MQKKSFHCLALILLTATLLLIALNPIMSVKGQGQATVTVLTSIGGSTDPVPGTTTYADGSQVVLTATAGDGFAFQYWVIATASGPTVVYDNPHTLTVSAGTTYAVQAQFQVLNTAYPPSVLTGSVANVTSSQAIVVLLPGIGGTTTPGPGTYVFTDATAFNISAAPMSGWKFDHWTIGGTPLNHGAYSFTATPTDNPYNINHGYGYTYSYQPVFVPTTVPEVSAVILPVALAIIFIIGALTTYAYKRRK